MRLFWVIDQSSFTFRLWQWNVSPSTKLELTRGTCTPQRGRSFLESNSALRLLCLSRLNGNRVFNKLLVRPRANLSPTTPVDAATAGLTHSTPHTACLNPLCRLPRGSQPTAHAAVAHSWLRLATLPSHAHVNTIIGRPLVPVNLLTKVMSCSPAGKKKKKQNQSIRVAACSGPRRPS